MAGALRCCAALLALTVAGCGGVIVQDWPGPRPGYFKGDLDYATRHGAIVTVIWGNPFGGAKPDFDARVRRYMRGWNRGRDADFVAQAGPRTDPLYKVVVAFNLAPGISTYKLCEGPKNVPSRARTGKLSMEIGFCMGDDLKSDTDGYVFGVTGIDDPRFAELVRLTTQAMTPEESYDDEGDDTVIPP